MKKSTLHIWLTAVFCCCSFLVFSQDVNTGKSNPDQPIFFSPRSHDPNYLKSAGEIPEKSFYQRKSEWQHIIDSTWGPGDSLERKLEIFNIYAQAIHDNSDVLCKLNVNWDSLNNHYLSQITESTSKGAFSSVMSHFAYDMKDGHTIAYNSSVVETALNPGVPLLMIGSINSVEHFGAVTTVLPDSTTLVLRVAPNHPLSLEPGDIILGYEGVPWKNLVTELFNAGLPMVAYSSGWKPSDTYAFLSGVGLNWHLFNTIDILKYTTGDTLHLSLLPLLDLNLPRMANNEQLAVKNIPFPKAYPSGEISIPDTIVTYGILENTNIGYIFLVRERPTDLTDIQFYNAVNALKNTEALIIDLRYNTGGDNYSSYAQFDNALNILFNEYHKPIEWVSRCNANTFELCNTGDWVRFEINGKYPDYYDRPIAVLLGPSCASLGEITAQRLRYHPMVKFFGASTAACYGNPYSLSFADWYFRLSVADMYHISQPGVYLNRSEFPIDYPVWFNKDDVAKGTDPIVEKSLEWINNLAYGHSIKTGNWVYSPEGDTIIIKADIEDPNSDEVSAKLIFESMDGTIIDSTDMTKICFLKETSWHDVEWTVPFKSENLYWVSLKVTNHTDGTSFTNKHMTRVTNKPLEIGTLSYTESSDNKYTIKTELKYSGESMNIISPIIKITSNNPWIKTITPETVTISVLKPGDIKRIPNFTVTVDESTFPGYVDLSYTISEDGWPYWVIDKTVAIIPTGIEQVESIPLTFGLEQNYPNPFNSSTTINWQLAQSSRVTLKVLDIVGRTVATIVDEQQPQGKYETQFSAATLPKGIYFYMLKAGEFSQTRKMILME